MSSAKVEQFINPSAHLIPVQEVTASPKSQRKYLPTFADLIDRFSITLMKSIFIHEHRDNYEKEIDLITHDINLLMSESNYTFDAEFLKAIMVIMLSNREIWLNESLARKGMNGQDGLLKFTHSVNGVRNTAKNVVSRAMGERLDWKVDCFAAELVEQFGNWNIHWTENKE
jgi:hypothetical protein